MLRVDQILCAARQEKGISLHQVEEVTKIPIRHLEAMERGEYSKIPARVYAVGFLRSYAAILGLDVKALVGQFNLEYPPIEDDEPGAYVPWSIWPFRRWKRCH